MQTRGRRGGLAPSATPWAGLALIALWAVFVLVLRRTASITDDWSGWLQADTMAIARHLAFDKLDLWRPRIDWGGNGLGYVEAEFPGRHHLSPPPTLSRRTSYRLANRPRAPGKSAAPSSGPTFHCDIR